MDTNQHFPDEDSPEGAEPGTTQVPDPVAALDRTFVLPDEPIGPSGSASGGGEVMQRMCFRVGELGLLLPWDAGREVVPPPSVTRIPNTVSWFAGLANVRGGLVPVVDIAAAFGVTRETGVPGYLLIFGQGEEALGLLIDGLPRLLDVRPSERIDSLPALPSVLEGDTVTGAYEHDGRVWLDLKFDALVETLGRSIAL